MGLFAEALSEGPCESAGMARPVNRLVATRGRIVIHAAEGRSVRQLDMIEGRCEVGLVSAMANVGRDSREEGVDRRLPLGRDQRLLRFVRGVEIGGSEERRGGKPGGSTGRFR